MIPSQSSSTALHVSAPPGCTLALPSQQSPVATVKPSPSMSGVLRKVVCSGETASDATAVAPAVRATTESLYRPAVSPVVFHEQLAPLHGDAGLAVLPAQSIGIHTADVSARYR
jgi:hypothetical protein